MLSQYLAKYVDQQQSLGFKFRVQLTLLRSFVAFAEEHGDEQIKSSRVLTWAACAPSPEQRRNRLLTVRRFALAGGRWRTAPLPISPWRPASVAANNKRANPFPIERPGRPV